MSEVVENASRPSALSLARRLAFPRQSGTTANLEAVELVSGWFEGAGLSVAREWFTYDIRPAFRALRSLLLGVAALLGAAAMVIDRIPPLALVLLAVALTGAGVFLAWAPGLEALYRRAGPTRAANIEGRRAAAAPRMTFVFLAHHDSKSQNLTLPFRAFFTLLAIVAAMGLAGMALVGTAAGTTAIPVAAARVLGLIGVVSLGALATLHNRNESPGGVDNAGSVGVLVELAHILPGRVPPEVELIFLSPGAEEDHMVGAMRWLDRHVGELADRPVWAINLDGAGIPGRVTLLERFGFGRMFSAELSAAARLAAADLDLAVRGILIPPAMGVDAIPFVHRGIPCLTLSSGSLGRASLSVHSKNDRFEHLDEVVLARVRDLVVRMVDVIVAGARISVRKEK